MSRGISTDDEFVQVEIAFSGMKWYKLDPPKIVVMLEVKNPNLSKVANFSTVELFAKAIPR